MKVEEPDRFAQVLAVVRAEEPRPPVWDRQVRAAGYAREQSRARRRLAELYPVRYSELLAAELAKFGLAPVPPRGLQPCGTTAAYIRHRKRGEQPCPMCRQAWRDYCRQPHTRAYQTARRHALAEMPHAFPDRFAELLAEQVAARGVEALTGGARARAMAGARATARLLLSRERPRDFKRLYAQAYPAALARAQETEQNASTGAGAARSAT
ncbi:MULTISPECIES: hypothetical protein [Actinomadura]|uniref:Uncharacterized protein n=1 Tax=Actinomadura yumaensis TaxID=111807 RepID=A0ABW2CXK3_9ACTN|nr:hypothetical protein [Actinomadura sp. J1-007]MWK39603.1 hypothetical protein [Actinomadura sp. J1-007]